MAYKYKIWVRRSDTHDNIGNEDILVGNANNEHSKYTSGLTIDKYFSYVEFSSWEELVGSVTGSTCTPELTWDEPAEIKYDYKTQSQGSIPQSGGTWILSASTTCDLNITAFTLDTGSGFVTLSQNLTNGTCSMRVNENTNKDSGRTITVTVHTADPTIKHTWKWEQSRADWEIVDADYLAFKYTWGEGGTDLDTFTFMEYTNGGSPETWQTGVGYSGKYTTPPDATISTTGTGDNILEFNPDTALLVWAGDNTGFGSEHTLINFKKIKDLGKDVNIYIMGNWYNCSREQECEISLTPYRCDSSNCLPNNKPSRTTGFTINGATQVPGTATSVKNMCYARLRDNHNSPKQRYTLLSFVQYIHSENKVYLYAGENEKAPIPDAYKNCIGYYRTFIIDTIIRNEKGETHDIMTNQESGCSTTANFDFTGATELHVSVRPQNLFYRNNTKAIEQTQDFRANYIHTNKSRWEDSDEHYHISNTGTTGNIYSFTIKFDNEGDYKDNNQRTLELVFDVIPDSSIGGPNADTFYIDFTQTKEEPQGPTTLEFVPIAWRGTEFNTTNGIGSSLLVIKTGNGQKLSEINTTYENEMAAFNNFGPFYLGDGMYFYEICKTLGYQTGVNYAAYKTKVKINSPDLDTDYEIISSASQIEHSIYGRILNARSTFTYYTLDYIPASGATIKKELCGLAFDAQEIVGNKMMHLNETWRQEVETDYTPQVFTVFPNNAEEMLSASLVLDYETTSATTIISPNTHPYPRVGYVQIPPYSGNRLIFVQNGTKKIFGFYPEYMKIYQTGNDVSNWRFMIDLDELHTEEKVLEFQRFSPSSICFHKGVSSLIKVVDGNGAVLSPVEKTDTDTGLIFETYVSTQTSSPCKFIISLKNE